MTSEKRVKIIEPDKMMRNCDACDYILGLDDADVLVEIKDIDELITGSQTQGETRHKIINKIYSKVICQLRTSLVFSQSKNKWYAFIGCITNHSYSSVWQGFIRQRFLKYTKLDRMHGINVRYFATDDEFVEFMKNKFEVEVNL